MKLVNEAVKPVVIEFTPEEAKMLYAICNRNITIGNALADKGIEYESYQISNFLGDVHGLIRKAGY